MKKYLPIIMIVLMFMISIDFTYADVGVPESPEYTVVIDINGAPYYSDWDSYDAGSPDGSLTGGLAFYVWADFGDGHLRGTTNAKASSSQYDSFVYIDSDYTLSTNTYISPDVGVRAQETVTANTTDLLNLRTGPGTGFKVIKVLDKGTEVHYDYTFTTDTNWMYVTASGLNGWVSGDYLRTVVSKPESSANTDNYGNDYNGNDESISNNQADDKANTLIAGGYENAKAQKRIVAGIILICLGVAILIAVFAAYLLKNRKSTV